MLKRIIQQGAEAVLYKKGKYLIKDRIVKKYRHPEIDMAKRKYPTRREAKLLVKSKKVGVNVPELISSDEKKMMLVMEFIKGDVLKNTLDNYSSSKRETICKKIGEQVAILHKNDIIHGDLTTSNMILKNEEVFIIDFGLGQVSNKVEAMAVDIHLLKQAFESKHYKNYEKFYSYFLKGYKNNKNFRLVLDRLEQVEKRGRYKRKK
ncbi:Kae1-associated serine/threonine protein kinase [archaeon]|nr:Kae1-associated serine/threonine protein kinase [archaeon]